MYKPTLEEKILTVYLNMNSTLVLKLFNFDYSCVRLEPYLKFEDVLKLKFVYNRMCVHLGKYFPLKQ